MAIVFSIVINFNQIFMDAGYFVHYYCFCFYFVVCINACSCIFSYSICFLISIQYHECNDTNMYPFSPNIYIYCKLLNLLLIKYCIDLIIVDVY